MKAWRVSLDDYMTGYVLSESRSKATWAAIQEYMSTWGGDWDYFRWKDVRTTRMPLIDGDSFTTIPLILAGNMWDECPLCQRRIDREEVVFAPEGAPFCSQECIDACTPGCTARTHVDTFGPGEVLMLCSDC